MAESLDGELVATYAVGITGIERTKAEMLRLDQAIALLRKTEYSPGVSVSEARFGTNRSAKMLNGKDDIFVASIVQLEGRIQTRVSDAMAHAMAVGKRVQAATLRAAETETGLKGGSRNGPGRDKTGEMIKELATNVETQKVAAVTTIVGWHGWGRDRADYFLYQEKGTKGRKSGQQPGSLNRKVKARRKGAAAGRGVPAANSLGAAIIITREELKRGLAGLK